MNLLISGICLIIAIMVHPLSSTMTLVALINIFVTGENLLPLTGFDGEEALSAACGVAHINKVAKKWLFNKKRRKLLFSSGAQGYACACIFSLTILSEILPLLFIGFNIFIIVYVL